MTNQKNIIKHISLGIFAWAFCMRCNGQNLSVKNISDSLLAVENSSMDDAVKIKKMYVLKKQFDQSKFPQDSVYARLLHRIGLYEYNAYKNFNAAITFTKQSVAINLSGEKNACGWFAIKSYINLGIYYNDAGFADKGLAYHDSALQVYKKYPSYSDLIKNLRMSRADIFFTKGDYQKSGEEAAIGLYEAKQRGAKHKDDSSDILNFFIQRSQAAGMQSQFLTAKADADSAYAYAKALNDAYNTASALFATGFVYEKQQQFVRAKNIYAKAISERIKTADQGQIANDFKRIGDFYLTILNNYDQAKQYYLKGVNYSKLANDMDQLSQIYTDMGAMYFFQHDYKNAEQYYLKVFEILKCSTGNNILLNPASATISRVNNKDLILVLLDNKADLLLNVFKKTKDKKYLYACLQTCLLSDSVITELRHEQSGEQSKLYWRNKTHEIYSFAVEASYLNNDPSGAFYFMEKSRAVLLNDKLNELGAAAQLPPSEAAKQENFQINIIEQQQKLSSLDESSPEYSKQQSKFLNAKEDFQHYIKSLEQKYPAYYQYKYADSVPSLNALQHYLSASNQSFIHYFIHDTVVYILGITANSTKFIKLTQKDFNSQQINKFLQFCSSKDSLNSHHPSFASLSNSIYKNLFQQLQLPKGRVIICPDNFLIPFEALCTDADRKNFLINDYSFTYVYAARNVLMKQINNNIATGNFLGFAPVSFSSYLSVPDLTNSSKAINVSAANYSINKIFTEKNASRKNFFLQFPNYNIVNIFSHAVADSTDIEPRLFMQDSVIHLSELQLINHPATQLVVLSACQTNVGKNATGEGIYSLARGFASVGIPAVSATLWKADEDAIYSITEMFNKNLAKGMQKDEALQQAKLSFMQNNSGDKLLPYFWANMILVGNTDPVKLSVGNHYWWWVAGSALLLLAVSIFFWRKRIASSKKLFTNDSAKCLLH